MVPGVPLTITALLTARQHVIWIAILAYVGFVILVVAATEVPVRTNVITADAPGLMALGAIVLILRMLFVRRLLPEQPPAWLKSPGVGANPPAAGPILLAGECHAGCPC